MAEYILKKSGMALTDENGTNILKSMSSQANKDTIAKLARDNNGAALSRAIDEGKLVETIPGLNSLIKPVQPDKDVNKNGPGLAGPGKK